MSNPANAVFERYAETGFYTATTAEPVVKITVRDAKGAGTGAGDVEFIYDSVAKNWKNGDTEEDIPGYHESAESVSKTDIKLGKQITTGTLTNAGDWMISVPNMSGYAVPERQGETDLNTYLNRVFTDVQLVWGNGKAAKRTVYMDSNIALTDGTAPVSSGSAKTIPNLYEAINDMDTRIDRIDKEYGVSTADAGLFVTHHAGGNNPYKSFIREDNTNAIEITAGNMLNADRKLNATGTGKASGKDYNMHFKANEITFTVTNPNATVTAYEINEADMANATGTKINAEDAYDAATAISGLNGYVTAKYYVIPLEGGEKYITSEEKDGTTTYSLPSTLHCMVWRKVSYKPSGPGGNSAKDEFNSFVKQLAADPVRQQAGETLIAFLETSDGLAIKYMSEAILGKDVTTTIINTKFIVANETTTYNLGAIIEAIQELNRRTMFMDTDMSFNSAMSYNDYSAENTPGSAYGTVIDGLPAGTDNNLSKDAATG